MENVRIRISFDLTQEEADALCASMFEPKPSTAAAQVVRRHIAKAKEEAK